MWEVFRKAKSGTGGFSKGDFATKWLKRAEEWNVAEQEKMDRKLDQAWRDYQSALRDRGLKRRQREREERDKKRARRKRRARLITAKLEDMQMPTYKDWPVHMPSGSDYFVSIWDDAYTELYRFHQGALQVVATNFAHYELRDPRSGRQCVVPAPASHVPRPRNTCPADRGGLLARIRSRSPALGIGYRAGDALASTPPL